MWRPHIHARRENKEAKFWVDEIDVAFNKGFRGDELRKLQRIIEIEQHDILIYWYGFTLTIKEHPQGSAGCRKGINSVEDVQHSCA